MASKDKQFQNFANFLADYGTKREAGEEVDTATEWLLFLAEQTAEKTDQDD